jgi:Pin2-interacting protein X1
VAAGRPPTPSSSEASDSDGSDASSSSSDEEEVAAKAKTTASAPAAASSGKQGKKGQKGLEPDTQPAGAAADEGEGGGPKPWWAGIFVKSAHRVGGKTSQKGSGKTKKSAGQAGGSEAAAGGGDKIRIHGFREEDQENLYEQVRTGEQAARCMSVVLCVVVAYMTCFAWCFARHQQMQY